MSNAAFKQNFAKLLAQAGNKADLVVRKTALELQSMMIEESPVDSGRFKGNWQAGVSATNSGINSPEDTTPFGEKDEGKSYAYTQNALKGWKAGQTIYLTNSLPYARVLEYGRANGKPGSMQAPGGMVRLAVQNYSQALAKAVSEIK